MLECKACISRCIRTVFADIILNYRQPGIQLWSTAIFCDAPSLPPARRAYHSARTIRNAPFGRRVVQVPHGRSPWAPRRQATQAISKNGVPLEPPPSPERIRKINPSAKRNLVAPKGRHAFAVKALELRNKKRLERELLYLQDPLNLAQNTVTLLRNDDRDKALAIVRMASKSTPCTVSWNHLIDYEMSKGRVERAEKIYNEVTFLSQRF